ncbi:MAG: FtsX-like permease family protein [Lachnospiraceae bacterium]|nr:FtsX-like permease family protein [Lachnospiraceae bacterium]
MKSYLSLIPISAKVHKRQSRMTRICIILAVFLVTSIFSMLEMWMDGQTTAMRQKHGDWHIALQNIPENEAKKIRDNSKIAFSSWYDEINVDVDQGYYINDRNAVLYGIEETYVTDIMNYPTEGSYPKNKKEVALSADAKDLFGIKVGDNITLKTPAGELGYIVSGFYEDDTEFNEMKEGSCVYMSKETFDEVRSLNGVKASSQFYIRFQKERKLKKTIATIKDQYNLTSKNIRENTAVLSLLGASTNESMNGLYPLAAACFVIILIAGVLMISGCMNSHVAQRTKFFGMMRCVGASKQQIVRFVRLEALNWCKTAIPIGCALGTVTCWILCVILRFLVKGEWVDMPLFTVSISGILCGAIVGVVTVFIAAQSPAKQAAKVSPVAAVSGNAESSKKVIHAANTRLLKVETSLGVHHATGNKKNLFLMTGSFALTIVLFLAFSACLDIVHKLLPSTSDFTPDITISSSENTNSIDRNIVTKIEKIPGVERALGTMYEVKFPAKINGNEQVIDLVSYGKFMLNRTEKSVTSGELSKIYGNSDNALTIFSEDSHLDVGDKITIGNNELEIACVASEGIGSISGSPVVVCSEKTFTRLTGKQGYMMVNVILGKNATKATVSEIRNLAGENSFVDRREANSDSYSSYWVFRLATYGFLTIIFLITILNIMNSISMSVSARIKQYGAMRAVGMESRQVTKMITAEAVTYAICGTIAGIILGLIFHYLIYVKLIISHFGGSWNIPFTAIAIIFLLVAFSCVIAIHGPAKRIRNMAVTDTINEL